jgi:hypothetical protein
MKFRLLVAVLAVLSAVPAVAQVPSRDVPPGLVYDLGSIPGGKIIDLPSWACGNIAVRKFDYGENILVIAVNIPKDLSPNEAAYIRNSGMTVELKPGSIYTLRLASGTAFSLYWKYSDDIPQHVLLVLRRHCSTNGCQKICDCEP